MRLPTRRAEKLKIRPNEGPLYMTLEGIEKMKRQLERITKQDLPQAIEDVRTTGEMGDFSENAEYQEAKSRMRRFHNRVLNLKDKIKRAVPIEHVESDKVCLGSTVLLESENQERKTFEVVGPQETDPFKDRISYISPIGSQLMDR